MLVITEFDISSIILVKVVILMDLSKLKTVKNFINRKRIGCEKTVVRQHQITRLKRRTDTIWTTKLRLIGLYNVMKKIRKRKRSTRTKELIKRADKQLI